LNFVHNLKSLISIFLISSAVKCEFLHLSSYFSILYCLINLSFIFLKLRYVLYPSESLDEYDVLYDL